MLRLPPRSTRTDPLFPYTTLVRALRQCVILNQPLRGRTPQLLVRPLRDDLPDLRGVEFRGPFLRKTPIAGLLRHMEVDVTLKNDLEGSDLPVGALLVPLDRKCDVQRKSVSICFDLGGRGINKK